MLENPNEVITRRKETTLIEQKNNHQIQQSAALPKKQILIPVVHEVNDLKSSVNLFKKEQVARLKEEQIGYIKLQDVSSAPSADAYEPDSEDLEFVRSLLPKEFKSVQMNDPAVFGFAASRDFVRAIDYIESTRDFSFKGLPAQNSRLNADMLAKVVEYWKAKTLRTKYPLKRKYWLANIKKEEFGKLDQLRVGYRDREQEKRKTRTSRKMSEAELLSQLRLIHQNSKVVESLFGLVILREKARFCSVKARVEGFESAKQFRDQHLPGLEKQLEAYRALYEQFNPPPTLPPSPKALPAEAPLPESEKPKPQSPPDNQIACYIATLVVELAKFDFDINDIKSENIGQINAKVRALKQSQSAHSQTANSEKLISLTAHPAKPKLPSFDHFVPYKRFSFHCAGDVYIEKVDREQFLLESQGPLRDNFVSDHLLKRSLVRFYQEHSMFRLRPTSGLNPEFYGDAETFSTSNANFESLKNLRNIKLLEDIPGLADQSFEESPSDAERSDASVAAKAQREIGELNRANGFKNWLSSKRVKTSS